MFQNRTTDNIKRFVFIGISGLYRAPECCGTCPHYHRREPAKADRQVQRLYQRSLLQGKRSLWFCRVFFVYPHCTDIVHDVVLTPLFVHLFAVYPSTSQMAMEISLSPTGKPPLLRTLESTSSTMALRLAVLSLTASSTMTSSWLAISTTSP